MVHNDPAEFDEIYKNGGWDGKGSGPGSTEAFTRRFREVFQNLLVERNIRSVFDLGCGDWQWQQHVSWGDTIYTGWDISQRAIEIAGDRIVGAARNATYAIVRTLDAFDQPLWPEADLLIVKDVVHHISPYRVRMLVDRAKYYSHVLWVLDVPEYPPLNGPPESIQAIDPINWCCNKFGPPGVLVHIFDTTVEDYHYGPKAAFLQVNP